MNSVICVCYLFTAIAYFCAAYLEHSTQRHVDVGLGISWLILAAIWFAIVWRL